MSRSITPISVDNYDIREEYRFIEDETKSKKDYEALKSAVVFILNQMSRDKYLKESIEKHLESLSSSKLIKMFVYNIWFDSISFSKEATDHFKKVLKDRPFAYEGIVIGEFEKDHKYKNDVTFHSKYMEHLTEGQYFSDFNIDKLNDRQKFMNAIGFNIKNNAIYNKRGTFYFTIEFEETTNKYLSSHPYNGVHSLYSATKLGSDLITFIETISKNYNDFSYTTIKTIESMLLKNRIKNIFCDKSNNITKEAFIIINKYLNYNNYGPVNSLYNIWKIDNTKTIKLAEIINEEFGFGYEQNEELMDKLVSALFTYKSKIESNHSIALYYLSKDKCIVNTHAINIINEILQSHPYYFELSSINYIKCRTYVARYNRPEIWKSFSEGLYNHVSKYYTFEDYIQGGYEFPKEYRHIMSKSAKFSSIFKSYAALTEQNIGEYNSANRKYSSRHK
jgi:hypothetical protein